MEWRRWRPRLVPTVLLGSLVLVLAATTLVVTAGDGDERAARGLLEAATGAGEGDEAPPTTVQIPEAPAEEQPGDAGGIDGAPAGDAGEEPPPGDPAAAPAQEVAAPEPVTVQVTGFQVPEGMGEGDIASTNPSQEAALACASAEMALDALDSGDAGGFRLMVAEAAGLAGTAPEPTVRAAAAVLGEAGTSSDPAPALSLFLEACLTAGYRI